MRSPFALALAAFALVASACPLPEPDPSPSPGELSGEVSFMVFGDPEELQAFRDAIDAFRDMAPNVTVNLVEASDRSDLIARLSTSFSAGAPPDLFLLNYRFYAQFAARGVLEPIEPYVEGSDAFSVEDFYEPPMEAFTFDGRLTCLPQNVSSLVVYYNRDAFADAGVVRPDAGWTWDDMVSAAQSLTIDEGNDGTVDQYGLGVDPEIIRLAPFVWSNGGEVVDDEENPTRFTLDTPEAQEAFQKFVDLRRVHLVVPNEEEIESEDHESRFMNGTTAMVMSSRRSTPAFRTITDFEWDVVPIPVLSEPAGILHSDAYCMTRASGNKDAAWAFMEFALGPEGQRITSAVGRTVPSLVEVAESRAFLDPAVAPASSQVFLDTIPVIRRVPNISTWPEIEDAVNPILETAFYETGDVQEAARLIDEATREIFARAE
jgi:multiple sugar transport system substrate-binding protein